MWFVVAASAASLVELVDACGFPDGMVTLGPRAERVELTLSPALDAVRDLALTRADLGALVAPGAALEPARARAVALCMGSLHPLTLEGWLRGGDARARVHDGVFRYPELGVGFRYTRTGRRTVSIEVHDVL